MPCAVKIWSPTMQHALNPLSPYLINFSSYKPNKKYVLVFYVRLCTDDCFSKTLTNITLLNDIRLQLVFQLTLDNLFKSAAIDTPQVSVVGCALESLCSLKDRVPAFCLGVIFPMPFKVIPLK